MKEPMARGRQTDAEADSYPRPLERRPSGDSDEALAGLLLRSAGLSAIRAKNLAELRRLRSREGI